MAAVGEPDPEAANFPDYDDAFLAMLNDMDVVPEDVRGADVGEARDGWFCLRTVVNLLSMGCADRALAVGRAALRSPEPAAEPDGAEDGQ
jgi:hypothetical protein